MPAPAGVQPTDLDPEPSSEAEPSVARPTEPSELRPRRRWLRVLRAVGLVILLPVLALLIGLLIAWIVHLIRGSSPVHTGQSPAPQPSASVASTAPTNKVPTSAPPAVTVPSDWVAETQPPLGITYRHPAGWVRRTSGTAVLRFAPVTPGSLTPGIDGVGAQLAPVGTTPDAAIRTFVSSNYGGQPGYKAAAPAPVPVSTPGAHKGELRTEVSYTRSGVPVRVVVDAYPVATATGTRTVLVLGRSTAAMPARAATLESFIEASLKVS